MKKLTSFFISLSLVFLFAGSSYSVDRGNTTSQSFSKAKKKLLKQVYYDHKTTFYCGCPSSSDKKIIPSENYTPKKESKRAHGLEWEHIVPAHAFCQSFPEWRTGHPDCVNKKGKPSRVEIVPGRLPFHSDTWNPICTICSRQLGK